MDIKNELADFKFKHKFGQNFIFDTNLLKAIVSDANIQDDDCVLEIGPGAGTLTKEILNKTNSRVVAVEIDESLKDVLQKNVGNFSNLTLKFGDILKISPDEIKKLFNNKPFKVVANLPYYISTPILFYLLENDFNITSITIMLQYEVAKRLTAEKNTKDYGQLTVLLDLLGDVNLKRKVPKKMFTPSPNVDSAIVNIVINNKYNVDYKDIAPFIKQSFSMRRKTLENNLFEKYNLSREEFKQLLIDCNIKENARAEDLTSQDFIKLFKAIKSKK